MDPLLEPPSADLPIIFLTRSVTKVLTWSVRAMIVASAGFGPQKNAFDLSEWEQQAQEKAELGGDYRFSPQRPLHRCIRAFSELLREGRLHRQHGARCPADNLLSNTSHESPAQARPPMGAHDNQVGVGFRGDAQDLGCWNPFGELALHPHLGAGRR